MLQQAASRPEPPPPATAAPPPALVEQIHHHRHRNPEYQHAHTDFAHETSVPEDIEHHPFTHHEDELLEEREGKRLSMHGRTDDKFHTFAEEKHNALGDGVIRLLYHHRLVHALEQWMDMVDDRLAAEDSKRLEQQARLRIRALKLRRLIHVWNDDSAQARREAAFRRMIRQQRGEKEGDGNEYDSAPKVGEPCAALAQMLKCLPSTQSSDLLRA